MQHLRFLELTTKLGHLKSQRERYLVLSPSASLSRDRRRRV